MTITLKNPNAPASIKQRIFLARLEGKSNEGEPLTMQQASERIEKAKANGPAHKEDKSMEYLNLFTRAGNAGIKAGLQVSPIPMHIVGYEPCMEGACGFAWVVIKPATSGFAKWLKDQGYADKHYHGGISVWVTAFNQSVERKYAYARAMAQVFTEAGYQAYADSRLD